MMRARVIHHSEYLALALLLIGASLAMVSLSFTGQLQTVMDVSLGAMSVFTILLAVLSTAMLLPKDMEDRTLYTILAKPVARFEYLIGKLTGVSMVLFVATLLMTGFFCLILLYWQQQEISQLQLNLPRGISEAEIAKIREAAIAKLKAGTFTPTVFGGIGVIFVRSVVCASLTLMLSCFSTSWLFTVISALMMILVGYLEPIARTAWQGPMGAASDHSTLLSAFLRLVTVFFPDMQLFNIVDDIAVGMTVGADVFLRVGALGAGYIAIYLLIGYLFFAWREL